MNQNTILIHSASDSIILVHESPAAHNLILLCMPGIYNTLIKYTLGYVHPSDNNTMQYIDVVLENGTFETYVILLSSVTQ